MIIDPAVRRPKRARSARTRAGLVFAVAMVLAVMAVAAPARAEAPRCVPREATNNFQGAAVHAPVAEGRCMECHNPHQRGRDRLLRDDVPGLCMDCHDQPLKDSAGRDIPSIKSLYAAAELPPEAGGVRLHQPFADGACTCCHDPHASSSRRLLNASYPGPHYARYTPERYMCLGCHDERAFAEPRTLEATRFRNGNLNLHHRHVNRDKGRSCSMCHEYHASSRDALIRHEIPFGRQTITIREFERTETGGSCAPTCHNRVAYDRVEPALNTIRVTPREGGDASMPELMQTGYPPPADAPAPE